MRVILPWHNSIAICDGRITRRWSADGRFSVQNLEWTISRILYPLRGHDHFTGTTVTRCLMQPTRRLQAGSLWNVFLFGLAPDGVYHALTVTCAGGELLPHHFTLTESRKIWRYIFCGTFRQSPNVRVTNHPALWSSDFPLGYHVPGRSCVHSKKSIFYAFSSTAS
jgi:hypothetical protein